MAFYANEKKKSVFLKTLSIQWWNIFTLVWLEHIAAMLGNCHNECASYDVRGP